MNELDFAHELEALMNEYHPNFEITSDKFRVEPAETLDIILLYLKADNRIENVNAFKEEYNFGKMTLREYIETYGEEKVEELVSQLESILKEGTKNEF